MDFLNSSNTSNLLVKWTDEIVLLYLLVVTGVETAIGDSEKSARLRVVSVLTVTFE